MKKERDIYEKQEVKSQVFTTKLVIPNNYALKEKSKNMNECVSLLNSNIEIKYSNSINVTTNNKE